MARRTQRNKKNFVTKTEKSETGGRDVVLVAVSSLSKQARNAWKEREKLKSFTEEFPDKKEDEQKLSRESYMEGRSSIMSIKGDKGKSLKLVPDLLVVPPALEETARLILEADQIDGTTNVLKGTAKLHVEPALAEHPEYWFLLCTNRFLKPFIYQLRKKIKFTSLTRDTDENVFMLDELVVFRELYPH
nr:MAG TPA: major capsid protein [Caudoviricetes sp.]